MTPSTTPTDHPQLAAPQRSPSLTEDWTVVVLGLLIIAVSLTGVLIPTPAFGWKNADELLTNVFTGANLTAIAGQFAFTYDFQLRHRAGSRQFDPAPRLAAGGPGYRTLG